MKKDSTTRLIRPFSTRAGFERIGVNASRGDGAYLVTPDGQRLFDSISGLWNVPLGYSCDPVKRAIATQLEELPASSQIVGTHDRAEAFAVALTEAIQVPSLQSVFLSSGGSEAVESAMKLSRHYFHSTGRAAKRVILSVRGSYHGMTFGALAATGIAEDKWQFGAGLPDVHQVSSPRVLLEADGNERFVAEISAAIDYFGPANIAALVLEPVFAVAGMIAIPAAALRRIRRLCSDAGIHLISDEVTTGVFRAGNTFLACSAADVEPDMAVMAKALTNGYVPIGAVAVSRDIEASLESEAFMHGHTFSGNPLACAAGIACLQTLSERQATAPLAVAAADALLASARRHLDGAAAIGAWRATGALLGVDLAYAPGRSAEDIARSSLQIRLECRRRGVIVRPTYGGRTFNFVPMYISTAGELDNMLAVFSDVAARALVERQ